MTSASSVGHQTSVPPDPRWHLVSTILAGFVVVLIASRLRLPAQQFAGPLLALAMLPLWLPGVWRDTWSRRLILMGSLAAASGALLSLLAEPDHKVSLTAAAFDSMALLGTMASIGALLWARRYIADPVLIALYGVGTLLAIRPDSGLFSSNPWKFGFSVGVTLIVLGLAQRSRNGWISVVMLLTLGVVSALNDARSAFGILLITALLVGWQLRPRRSIARSVSAIRMVATLSLVVLAIYNLGVGLILEGALGEATQQRSQVQVDTSGSLILGSRPEMGATISLFLHRPWGFGSGTFVNWQELMWAKEGMAELNYDPNNGYVERYMFGQGIELHSTAGDLWARFGLVGLGLAAIVVIVICRSLASKISSQAACAALIFLAIKTLWNLFFGPLYTSETLMILLLGLALPKAHSGPDSEADPAARPGYRSTKRST